MGEERAKAADWAALLGWDRAATTSDAFGQVLAHYESEGFLDSSAAAWALRVSLMFADKDAESVAVPKRLVKLLAQHLAGEMPERRGRRVPMFGNGKADWSDAEAVRAEFKDRRAAGEKYDALVVEFAAALQVSRATVEKWVSPKK